MKRLNKYYFPVLLCLLFLGTGCEDVIDVELDEGPTLFVVDAWLNNQDSVQTIRLTQTQSYFDSTFAKGVAGATVVVSNSAGFVMNFTDAGNGDYSWAAQPGESIGDSGMNYTLEIRYQGERFGATSTMNPVSVIDEITQEFRDDEFGADGIYTQFIARDLEGIGDTYWIKTYKNGLFLNKPSEINLAYDAGFDSGSEIDGIIFIPPIRDFTNPVPDTSEVDFSPWVAGDEIRVEIHSITHAAFAFMEIARDQILNGNNGIFAGPLANARGNMVNEDGDADVLGVFCVSAVSSLEKVIE